MDLSQFDETARLQLGLVTAAQLRASGVTTNQLRHWTRSGRLIRMQHHVYRFVGSTTSWKQQLLAISLSFDRKAAVSHRSAARIYGLPGFEEERAYDFTIAKTNARPITGITLHVVSKERLTSEARGPLRITPLPRTLLDLSATSSPAKVAAAIDFALNRRLVTPLQLENEFDAWAARGRKGTAKLRPILASILHDKTRSDLERTAREWIASSNLPQPVGQYIVSVGDIQHPLDLVWPEERVVVEPAGYRWHGNRRSFDEDAVKVAGLTAQGFRVIPMTSKTRKGELIENIQATLRYARTQSA